MRLKKVRYKLIEEDVGVFVANTRKVDYELVFTISHKEYMYPIYSDPMIGDSKYIGDKKGSCFVCVENLPDSILTGGYSLSNEKLDNLMYEVMNKLWEIIDDNYPYVDNFCERCFQTGMILKYTLDNEFHRRFILEECDCI